MAICLIMYCLCFSNLKGPTAMVSVLRLPQNTDPCPVCLTSTLTRMATNHVKPHPVARLEGQAHPPKPVASLTMVTQRRQPVLRMTYIQTACRRNCWLTKYETESKPRLPYQLLIYLGVMHPRRGVDVHRRSHQMSVTCPRKNSR